MESSTISAPADRAVDAPTLTEALRRTAAAHPEIVAVRTPAEAIAATGPDDVLTLIYTSGTTGPPKGVQISHHNVMVACRAVEQIITFPPGARVISWLPAAHIAERTAHHYIPAVYAGNITC